MDMQELEQIRLGLAEGRIIPYLGPGVLALNEEAGSIPATAHELVARLTAKSTVPHKIRTNLTAAAQFIENFKHRKTVKAAMNEAFAKPAHPTALHRYLAALPALPLWVNAWYDDLPQAALAHRAEPWGAAQGVSQAEHHGDWVHYFEADGNRRVEPVSEGEAPWPTLLYQPLGSVSPEGNYLVSDSDYVEVLTEIDIQTPIPEPVRELRKGRHFLFIGCRFSTQLERTFARQILKRSSEGHWAVLPDEPTRNERNFLEENGIARIETPLAEWVAALTGE